MIVTINGRVTEHGVGTTVADAAASLLGNPQNANSEVPTGVAIAHNGTVLPQSKWASTPIQDGDTLEVLTAFAGG